MSHEVKTSLLKVEYIVNSDVIIIVYYYGHFTFVSNKKDLA